MSFEKAENGKIDFMGRRRSRALVMQGLYQYQLAAGSMDDIRLHLMDSPNYLRCDAEYFDLLWRGVARDYEALRATFQPFLSREEGSLSPVEQAILVLSSWELIHCPEIPYRVVLNEAVDLAKVFGGTDGHKFVNGVLDKLALEKRADEIRAAARMAARHTP